ncbi:porin [Marivirga aurantiaca]|uniref:porin n=1 Tax=Marivirga aurantiaca TaxID=2802615 RepID=UPI00293D58C0|nr:porin [Marivirga aurantiaca]
MKRILLSIAVLLIANTVYSQNQKTDTLPYPASHTKWYDNISIGGYVQARYNRLLETNPDLECRQCDSSWGEGGGISLRRVRLKFSGNLGDYVYFYIQPDFASGGMGQHFGQIRDAYFEVGLTKKKEFRFRIGQSKVPFGFENMQSSQNRLPLDRNDGINSSIKNERELSVFFYYTPERIQELYKTVVREGLKGSGDYGIFGFGVFNGQTGNAPELNNELHVVARASYPFQVGNQIIEPGIQAYTGKYQMPLGNLSPGVSVRDDLNYLDQRIAATFVLYPQPFGIQAEYNIGRGPEFNKETGAIEETPLHGGYATLSYRMVLGSQLLYPFLRYHTYDGGKKFERDARSYEVNELEIGFEWRPVKAFELVAHYTLSSRRFEDFQRPDNLQEGGLLRLQAQVNF